MKFVSFCFYNRGDAKAQSLKTETYNDLGKHILDGSIQVHKQLGPGLLESVYVYALLKEFELRKIKALKKEIIPLFYKGYDTGKIFEIDILVEDEIILEIKAVEIMHQFFTHNY